MDIRIKKVVIEGKEYELSKRTNSKKNIISVLTGKNSSGKSRILEFISSNFALSASYLQEHPQNWGDTFNGVENNFFSYTNNKLYYQVDGSLDFSNKRHTLTC